MPSTSDICTVAPHTLKAMGVVTLGMSACKGGGNGGREDDEVKCIGEHDRQVGEVGVLASGRRSWCRGKGA